MSTLKCTTISKQDGSASVPTDTVVNGTAKAWVNFNGTGTIAIRAAFNVSSITDNGVGDWTLNFTNALVDANYVVAGASNNSASVPAIIINTTAPPTTTALRITHVEGGSPGDVTVQTIVVFR